ncbi:kinase-like domain-containing protein [Mycena alexandri]|uniref:Kinase-like domain-containing protein n=1 Tax=Mycena alexandri TaxID=1745969 RepID=A0AAD6TBP3_9AGAR|nr:kinase-like domain-containing protein [Mycena alexandri]
MRQVYELDHLRLIPWSYECSCWESCLAAAGESSRPSFKLGKESPILLALYELVVPPWPLVYWVAFRTLVPDGTVHAFLDILHTADQDLLEWDDDDSSDIFVALQEPGEPSYPQRWTRYMVEIDLQTWLRIRRATWTEDRVRHGFGVEVDIAHRLIAVTLSYFTETDLENLHGSLEDILSPLRLGGIDLAWELSNIVPAIVDDGERSATIVDFESKEFWANPNLVNWQSICQKNLVQTIWNTPTINILSRVRYIGFVTGRGGAMFENLAMYTYCLIMQQQQLEDGRCTSMLKQFWEFSSAVMDRPAFARCSFECDTVFDFLKQLVDHETYSRASHTISLSVHEKMNRDIPGITAALVTELQAPEGSKQFLKARETVAQSSLDFLQDLLDLDAFPVVKSLMWKNLVRLSHASELHPRCFPIIGLQKIGQQVAGGGFGDIWKGLLRGQSVSVKIMRVFQEQEVEAALKEFGREALIWRQLYHPNLLPFFGLYYLDNRLCLVSPWMENGNIMQFLSKKSPNISYRLSLILDVALGLQYLHEQKVVHGDLKAINILVTPSGRACICDFGVSSIANEITMRLHATTTARGGTTRYCAPELFQEKNKKHFPSDVYAFACVCYEILTGKVPFYDANDASVILKVIQGGHPLRLPSCSGTAKLDNLWELLRRCWAGNPDMRPNAAQIVEQLVDSSIGAKVTSSTTDWNENFTCKFRRSLQDRPLLASVNQIERMLFGEEVAQACRECFPDRESSESQGKQDKRRYKDLEETSDSEQEDVRSSTKRPRASTPEPWSWYGSFSATLVNDHPPRPRTRRATRGVGQSWA